MNSGRPEEAVEFYEKAIALDPLSHYLNCGYGGTLLDAGLYDDAILQAERTLNLETTCPFEHMVKGSGYLGKDMHDEGIAEINIAIGESEGHPGAIMALAEAHCKSGDSLKCDEYNEQLLEYLNSDEMGPYMKAMLYAFNDENEKALDYLEEALKQRSSGMPGIMVESSFAKLVNEPRFISILDQMGLEPLSPSN